MEIALRNVAADRIGELSVGQTKIVRSVKSSEELSLVLPALRIGQDL